MGAVRAIQNNPYVRNSNNLTDLSDCQYAIAELHRLIKVHGRKTVLLKRLGVVRKKMFRIESKIQLI